MTSKTARPPTSHAQVHGSPGARVRLMGLARSLWPLILVLMAFGYLIRAALPQPALSMSITGLLFLALAVAVAAAANYSRERLARYLKGARGEESVARTLDALPTGWQIFHGVALSNHALTRGGGADIDHVVVSPQTIFAIETKNWSGEITATHNTLLCDGVHPDQDPLEQIKSAAAELRQCLADANGDDDEERAIIPILCFCGHATLHGITGLAGVMICNEQSLCAIMQSHHEPKLPEGFRNSALKMLKSAVEK